MQSELLLTTAEHA